MRTLRLGRSLGLALALCAPAGLASAYPTDAGARTGIRRLDWQRKKDEAAKPPRGLPSGARWGSDRVRLRLTGQGHDLDLPAGAPKDEALQAGLQAILSRNACKDYRVAIFDLSDPPMPRFAGVREEERQTPGSVAKVLPAAALLDQVRRRFPDDVAAREAFLREVSVVADHWAMPNSHQVPVITAKGAQVRRVLAGDRFSLWEWIDHALSPSSNAAGTTIWREATLMALLGADYPPKARDDRTIARWDRTSFSDAAFTAIDGPQTEAGLDAADFELRSFFTKGAGRYLRSGTSRVGPRALLRWWLRVEQGRMGDAWVSLELKRMLYLTRRRVRYAQAPELAEHAVYFKSGSLFECVKEPGFTCVQYQGNKTNVLNALVAVETADGRHHYVIAVMSNELKKNAATDHGRLAGEIHRLVTRP
jgi:hypothetical protein